jgi:hypothetical protein
MMDEKRVCVCEFVLYGDWRKKGGFLYYMEIGEKREV